MNIELLQGDCLDVMDLIADNEIDMVLTDPPYGTTACKWDSIIQLDKMWLHLERVAKERAAIVLTASQPFTSSLINSNYKLFKYCWYWHKNRPTGFANAKKQPLREIEEVVVFYKKQPTYSPVGLTKINKKVSNSSSAGGTSLRRDLTKSAGKGSLRTAGHEYVQEYTNYPRQVLGFKSETGLHPTQKPVALMEYLIKTYTNEGDTVLDFTMGSGTTGVACKNLNRSFIGIEKDEKYFNIAEGRVFNA